MKTAMRCFLTSTLCLCCLWTTGCRKSVNVETLKPTEMVACEDKPTLELAIHNMAAPLFIALQDMTEHGDAQKANLRITAPDEQLKLLKTIIRQTVEAEDINKDHFIKTCCSQEVVDYFTWNMTTMKKIRSLIKARNKQMKSVPEAYYGLASRVYAHKVSENLEKEITCSKQRPLDFTGIPQDFEVPAKPTVQAAAHNMAIILCRMIPADTFMPEYLVLKRGKQSFTNVVNTLIQELHHMDEEVDMLCDTQFLTFQKKHDAELHRITSQLVELKQHAPEPPSQLAVLEASLKPKLRTKISGALLKK